MTNPLVLLAAALLAVPGRRIRALAMGDDTALRDWIVNESVERLAEARRDAGLAMDRLESLGGRVIALDDPHYPPGLRDLGDPPAFLCALGRLPRAFRSGTAIIGSRSADAEARAFAHRFATLAPGPIVSGLALGVDAAAHEGALAAGVPTIAYVGHGIGATYPPEHAELEARIVAAGGAILSEVLPDAPATSRSLVRRDRLQAAHAAAVVMVTSEPGGGAMHTMRAAAKLGRPRFACEPRAGRDDGNRVALAEGAQSLPWNATAWQTYSTPST